MKYKTDKEAVEAAVSEVSAASHIMHLPALILAICAALFFGGQGLWTCITNLSQTPVAYSTFKQQRTSAKWVKLKNCQLDSMNMAWLTTDKSDKICEVFVPLRVPGEDPSEPIHALLAMEDPIALDLADRCRVATSELEMKNYTMIRKIPWNETRDVDGLIRYGLTNSGEKYEVVKASFPNLAPDFVIIDNNAQPNFWLSILLFGVGSIFVWPFIRMFYRWKFPSGQGPQRMEMAKP